MPAVKLTTEPHAWVERGVNGRAVRFNLACVDGIWMFGAAGRRWRLGAPGTAAQFKAGRWGFTSTFVLHAANQAPFTIRYVHLWRSVWERIDPTYDGLDRSEDHPLLQVTDLANASPLDTERHAALD